MIKQSITFEDFDGNEVTEDHYFHLTKGELIEMELAQEGGMADMLTKITQSGDSRQIIKAFKDIISAAYGKRDPANPQKFEKSPFISKAFMDSLAFDAFFSELLTDTEIGIKFVNGVVPKDLIAMAAKSSADNEKNVFNSPPDPNKLDTGKGTWPNQGTDLLADIKTSGLQNPYDEEGKLLPWAHREPTQRELGSMTQNQLREAFVRKSSDWVPSE